MHHCGGSRGNTPAEAGREGRTGGGRCAWTPGPAVASPARAPRLRALSCPAAQPAPPGWSPGPWAAASGPVSARPDCPQLPPTAGGPALRSGRLDPARPLEGHLVAPLATQGGEGRGRAREWGLTRRPGVVRPYPLLPLGVGSDLITRTSVLGFQKAVEENEPRSDMGAALHPFPWCGPEAQSLLCCGGRGGLRASQDPEANLLLVTN